MSRGTLEGDEQRYKSFDGGGVKTRSKVGYAEVQQDPTDMTYYDGGGATGGQEEQQGDKKDRENTLEGYFLKRKTRKKTTGVECSRRVNLIRMTRLAGRMRREKRVC